MKAYHIGLFIICICLAFPLLEPTGIFSHSGPGNVSLETMPHYSDAFLVGGVVLVLVAGGIVIVGFSFKTSAVVGAFGLVYIFSVASMEAFLWQLMGISGLTHSESGLIIGILTALFGFIGVWGALQLAGTPTGIMD